MIEFDKEFLSTPSARRATSAVLSTLPSPTISIHALREEGDRNTSGRRVSRLMISIHALREEGDIFTHTGRYRIVVFLSTPSARRATYFRMTDYTMHI